ncbi:hypothetical protein KEM55_001784 [Ascosphaera atra]|nr:hypothetical protein KEM55_001784 [Ascosphaera atra]
MIIDKKHASSYVIIENVLYYSFGQDDDGDISFWVAGPPGWFLITPNKAYKHVFDEMVEAVDLFYFLADSLKKSGRRKKNPVDMDKLFGDVWASTYLTAGSNESSTNVTQYNKHLGNRYKKAKDAAEIIYKHHEFLLKQMDLGTEGVNWKQTPIYRHLRELYPEEPAPTQKAPKQIVPDQEAPHPDEIIKPKKSKSPSPQTETPRVETIHNETEQIETAQLEADIHRAPTLSPEPSSSSDDEEDRLFPDGTPQQQRNWRGQVQTSILRPRLSARESSKGGGHPETSGKGNGRRPINDTPADGDGAIESIQDDTPSRVNNVSALSGSAAPEQANDTKENKTARPTASTEDGADNPNPGDEHDQDSYSNDSSSFRETSEGNPSASAEPSADTWRCPVSGCSKTVAKASMKHAKDMIQDHTLSHANDAKSMLDLVFSEQQRNVNVSVSHLVGRIRDYVGGNARQESEKRETEHSRAADAP